MRQGLITFDMDITSVMSSTRTVKYALNGITVVIVSSIVKGNT
jgi:hypothetical protein